MELKYLNFEIRKLTMEEAEMVYLEVKYRYKRDALLKQDRETKEVSLFDDQSTAADIAEICKSGIIFVYPEIDKGVIVLSYIFPHMYYEFNGKTNEGKYIEELSDEDRSIELERYAMETSMFGKPMSSPDITHSTRAGQLCNMDIYEYDLKESLILHLQHLQANAFTTRGRSKQQTELLLNEVCLKLEQR